MTNGSTSRRLVVAVLALACVSLALMWPTWRTVLAQVGGYGDTSSFLGCASKSGNLRVVLTEGVDVAGIGVGGSCAAALNDGSLIGCAIEEQTNAIDLTKPTRFGTLFHITCP